MLKEKIKNIHLVYIVFNVLNIIYMLSEPTRFQV